MTKDFQIDIQTEGKGEVDKLKQSISLFIQTSLEKIFLCSDFFLYLKNGMNLIFR